MPKRPEVVIDAWDHDMSHAKQIGGEMTPIFLHPGNKRFLILHISIEYQYNLLLYNMFSDNYNLPSTASEDNSSY